MPNVGLIRTLPNSELFDLELDSTAQPLVLIATLTDKAKTLGVRFDPTRKEFCSPRSYRFALSEAFNHGDEAQIARFNVHPKTVKIDLECKDQEPVKRVLRSISEQPKLQYKLDKHFGLVDYVNRHTNEIYFKLGRSERPAEKRTLVKSEKAKDADPEAYKRTFCIPLKIDFVEVWDTVASVGSLIPRNLAYIDYNPSIVVFRQALALDERRANFVPSQWNFEKMRDEQDNLKANQPDVREVWFRGEHSDIGGGANRPAKGKEREVAPYSELSNIPFRWMVQQCFECKAGIVFDHETMAMYRTLNVLENRLPPPGETPGTDHHEAIRKASADLDQIDIQHPVFDSTGWDKGWSGLEWNSLSAISTSLTSRLRSLGWCVLEAWPSSRPVEVEEKSDRTHAPNLFQPRTVYRRHEEDQILIHCSVFNYLATEQGQHYVPRTRWHDFNGKPPMINRPTIIDKEMDKGQQSTGPLTKTAAETWTHEAAQKNLKKAPESWTEWTKRTAAMPSQVMSLFRKTKKD